jgi:hypothetical protein
MVAVSTPTPYPLDELIFRQSFLECQNRWKKKANPLGYIGITPKVSNPTAESRGLGE